MTAQEAYHLATDYYNQLGIRHYDLEEIIATDVNFSYCYAYFILEDRFELGEPKISINGYYSCAYARYVLKGRFELGEYTVANSLLSKAEYEKLFNCNLDHLLE